MLVGGMGYGGVWAHIALGKGDDRAMASRTGGSARQDRGLVRVRPSVVFCFFLRARRILKVTVANKKKGLSHIKAAVRWVGTAPVGDRGRLAGGASCGWSGLLDRARGCRHSATLG